VKTGGHALSANAVLEGRADIAALDAMTWALLQRNDADMAGLRVIARTDPTPCLPYIAALGVPHRPVFDAIATAIATLNSADRALLGLKRLLFIPAPAYLAVPTPASPDQFVHEV
jgi:ABC-type phosphate/phosphonate transport system substrate-binding protein